MEAEPRGVVEHLRRASREGNADLADFLAGEIVTHLERLDRIEADAARAAEGTAEMSVEGRIAHARTHLQAARDAVARVPLTDALRDARSAGLAQIRQALTHLDMAALHPVAEPRIEPFAARLARYEMDEPHSEEDTLSGTAPLSAETLREWVALEHEGDCIQEPQPCRRCFAEHVLHKARWLLQRPRKEPVGGDDVRYGGTDPDRAGDAADTNASTQTEGDAP